MCDYCDKKEEVHDFAWAVTQMKKGKKVRCKSWTKEAHIYLKGTIRTKKICREGDVETQLVNFLNNIEATDWELVEEEVEEQWPKVFKDNMRKIEVNSFGIIKISSLKGDDLSVWNSSLDILKEAVELSNEIINKNEGDLEY